MLLYSAWRSWIAFTVEVCCFCACMVLLSALIFCHLFEVRGNWNNDNTGLVCAFPLSPYWCAAYAARWGGDPHYFCSSEWLKFLLTVGLVNLQGKLNSKPGSWIWTHLILKDSQVFSWASSSICFGGSCQAPEGCVDRCCCFLLIAMSK